MTTPDPRNRPTASVDDTTRPRRGSALPWILVLLALILVAWYFLGRGDAPADTTAPVGETSALPSQSPVSNPPATSEGTSPAPASTTPEGATPATSDR